MEGADGAGWLVLEPVSAVQIAEERSRQLDASAEVQELDSHGNLAQD